jgi:putative transposase
MGGSMNNRHRSQHIRRKYAFINAHRRECDTAVMCRLLDVSRSGFYAWLRNPFSDRARDDQRLLALIVTAYTASHGVYGALRIFLDLREPGETCRKHRVARIMRANHIKALHGYRAPPQIGVKSCCNTSLSSRRPGPLPYSWRIRPDY